MLPPDIPDYVMWVFIFTTFITLVFLCASNSNRKGMIIMLAVSLTLITVSGILAHNELFLQTDSYPPRLMLAVAPSILIIIGLFILPSGRKFIDTLSPVRLTWLHIVRVPVEIVLFWLCIATAVPQLMTFEGRNFDILAGVTAPFVAYFMGLNKINRNILIAWNIICLGLLLNIVINAILSAPFPFQKFAFDQPNVAVLYFPYVWLPCFVVPAVLFAHLTTLRHLLINKNR